MTIYTRTGDKGTTSLFGGKRVSKSDTRIEASGSMDELSAQLGLVATKLKEKQNKILVEETQKDLYKIMGAIAGAKVDIVYLHKRVTSFEQEIDNISTRLPELHSFILPGGTEVSALFHISRAVCRRAERALIRVFETQKPAKNNLLAVQYLNRLSDLLFILARYYGKSKETPVKL